MICAVIITYNPDISKIVDLFPLLLDQVDFIVIVDNGSDNQAEICSARFTDKNIETIFLEENRGIAAALNIGIVKASDFQCSHVLLLDQDSMPSFGMVHTLMGSLSCLTNAGHRVAAVGPRICNIGNNTLSDQVVFDGWRLAPVSVATGCDSAEVDVLITSGSLIPVEIISVVGGFKEDLFIDCVDTEWLLRAQSKGFSAYGSFTAILNHNLGDYRKRVWFGRWRNASFHKPFRYYYMYRNGVWLFSQPYVGKGWRRIEIFYLVKLLLFIMLFHPKRFTSIKMVVKGVLDGLRGRLGRIASPT